MTMRELRMTELCKMLEMSKQETYTLEAILKYPNYTHRELAEVLGVNFHTHKHRVSHIYRKLGAKEKPDFLQKLEVLLAD